MTERIKIIMEHFSLNPTQFAEILNINRSGLTHIFTGRNQPSLELARKVLTAFPQVNTEWLIMGVGDMINSEYTNEPVQPIGNKQSDEQPLQRVAQTSLFDEDITSEKSSKLEENINDNLPEEKQSEAPVSQRIITKEIKKEPQKRPREAGIARQPSTAKRISNSQEDEKQVVKIIFIYDDHTFATYYPENL